MALLLPLGPPLSGPPPQWGPYGAQRGAQCLAPAAARHAPLAHARAGLLAGWPWAGWAGLLKLDLD